MTDIDGNVYHTITIGTQVWMVENLKTTKYNDGTAIPLVTDNAAWRNLTTPGYCWYINNSIYKNTPYGALYNWYAVNTGKLAPTGWHVPTDSEWTVLINYLGGNSVAGGKLKDSTYWTSTNTCATNTTGFSAIPSGFRNYDGTFNNMGDYGYWWGASTAGDFIISWDCSVSDISSFLRNGNIFDYGFSIRCVKDNN